MKRTLLLLLSVMLLAGTAGFAVTYWQRPTGPIVQAPEALELGVQTIGDSISAPFVVGNAGDSPLHLSEFRSSCGCLSVTVLRQGLYVPIDNEAVVLPGERISLRSGIVPQGKSGVRFRARLQFATNDPKRPEVTIELVAELQGAVVVVPAALALGDLQPGAVVSRTVQVRDMGRRAGFRLHAVRSNAPGLVAVLRTRLSTSGEGMEKVNGTVATHTAELKVTAPTEPGPIHARLDVLEEGNPTPILQVPVSGHVVPPFRISPASLVFPRRSEGGLLYSAKCLCASTSGKPFTLTLLQAPEGITASVTKLNDSRHVIEVVADPAIRKPDGKPASLSFQAAAAGGNEALSLSVRVTAPD